MSLLEIKNLSVDFIIPGAQSIARPSPKPHLRTVRVVDNVSLTIEAGQTMGLVGESGCGKSVTALSIARLLPSPPALYARGQVQLDGRDVLQMSESDLRKIRGGLVSYIFQEPGASLNPVIRIGKQIKEALRLHQPDRATDHEVIILLNLVHIPAPETRARDYPFQLSGGMLQRVMTAMALASQPKMLVADEPTTALDVTIQAQILELFRELQQRLGMSILLISHNLGIVANLAEHVAVMYAGQIVESAPARRLVERPLHPYTKALINSIPRLKARANRLTTIPGNVPHPGAFPAGCRFAPRCPIAQPDCSHKPPELTQAEPNRFVRCPYWHET